MPTQATAMPPTAGSGAGRRPIHRGADRIQKRSSRINVEVKLQSLVEEALMGSSDPFLKVVDRESLASFARTKHGLERTDLERRRGNWEPAGCEGTLEGHHHHLRSTSEPIEPNNKTGYESYRVERVNEEGKKYYETNVPHVSYREYYQDASVDVACTFKFISTVTGEVVSTPTVWTGVGQHPLHRLWRKPQHVLPRRRTGARTGSTGRSDRERR